MAIDLRKARCHRALFYDLDDGFERSHTRRADWRILTLEQLTSFRRPRHQLAIDAEPVRRKLIPKAGFRERGLNSRDKLRFVGRFGEKRPPRSRVTDTGSAIDHTESLSRRLAIAADDNYGLEWAPKLRQADKAQNSSNGEKSHESISKEFHEGV